MRVEHVFFWFEIEDDDGMMLGVWWCTPAGGVLMVIVSDADDH